MTRIAVVGLGFMGKAHIGVYQQMKDVEITALCDEYAPNLNLSSLDAGGNIAASAGAVDLSGAQKFESFDDLLQAGGFDAVDLCIPTHKHRDYILQALHAGYHVFCEKPLARSLSEAEEINQAVEKTGRVVAVGQCLRFWPAYTTARSIIESETYGAVRHAEFARYSPPPTWSVNSWLGDTEKSGNAALDLHIHDVDMIAFFFGRPRSLRSVGIPDGHGSFSHISTVYTYDNLSVTSTGGWAFPTSYPFNMTARWIMEHGALDLDFSREAVLMIYPGDGDAKAVELPPGDGYSLELADFIHRVREGKPADIVSTREATVSLEIALQEIESARRGEEVNFT